MSEDDRETPNVNGKKPNGGVTQDVEVFAFFKDTEKVYKFKKFLTPVTEKNMDIF